MKEVTWSKNKYLQGKMYNVEKWILVDFLKKKTSNFNQNIQIFQRKSYISLYVLLSDFLYVQQIMIKGKFLFFGSGKKSKKAFRG